MTGGRIVSGGDSVQVRYILAHDRNGTIRVNVSEGAEITGARAGIRVQGAGLGPLGKDTPLGRTLGLEADEENLRQQFVTVHGKVTGGTNAAVHLAGGGMLVVGGLRL